MYDVVQTGFKINEPARECDAKILQKPLRFAGQAVGSGFMIEYSMLAIDYSVNTEGLHNF